MKNTPSPIPPQGELPMSALEAQIANLIRDSIAAAVTAALTSGYASNPLQQMTHAVIASRAPKITQLLEEAVDGGFAEEFRPMLKQAIAHKLAKVLVSKMEGEIEARANDIRSNPEFRAKIVVAISDVIKQVGNPSSK